MFNRSREKFATGSLTVSLSTGLLVLLWNFLAISVSAAPLTSSLYMRGDLSQYTSDLAGEFQLYNTTGINFNPGNAWVTPGTFQTFCIEYDINIAPATQYWSQISTQVAYGGVNNGPKALSPEVAYLFTRFTKGTLDNYTYTLGQGRTSDAHELQLALWALQNEVNAPKVGPADSKAAAWIAEASNAIALHQWDGLGDVRVLQLWGGGASGQSFDNAAQNQLVLINPGPTTPVPLPKSLWMGLVGLLSLAGFKSLSYRTRQVSR